MSQQKYLNLGCGKVILPAPKPERGYGLIPDGLTEYALWHNVDRNALPGVDEALDIFRYPWPWADNSFDGALCSHIVEHIPHEIKIQAHYPPLGEIGTLDGKHGFYILNHEEIALETSLQKRGPELAQMQDGWFAFFSELYRVLTPGSIIHILSPYGWSQGGITDPTHTRLLTEQTFTHSMTPDETSPFRYATGGINLPIAQPIAYTLTGLFNPHNQQELEYMLQRYINVVYDFYVQLRVEK